MELIILPLPVTRVILLTQYVNVDKTPHLLIAILLMQEQVMLGVNTIVMMEPAIYIQHVIQLTHRIKFVYAQTDFKKCF